MKPFRSKPPGGSWSHLPAFAFAFLWWLLAIALSSRDYFLLNYGALRSVDPMLEPFRSTLFANAFAIVAMIVWLVLRQLGLRSNDGRRSIMVATIFLAISLLPASAWITQRSAESVAIESIWSVFWMSAWTGLSFAELGRACGLETNEAYATSGELNATQSWIGFATVCVLSLTCGIWWTYQSYDFYNRFMLGFNDFGHFMQRVANTADGRGILLETPVLPAFWDHFNPGLLILVPLWKLFPDVTVAFYLQSISLAGSAILVWQIARAAGHRVLSAVIWSTAWLLQPVLGQMNLAYTYGWHPISLAIPLLLVSVLCLQKRRVGLAFASILLALSMEEGVFVIAALFCGLNAALRYGCFDRARTPETQIHNAMSWQAWTVLFLAFAVGFVVVFRFSGLAEFQTARFASLGQTPIQVLLSPVLRPGIFWGQLLSAKNGTFLLGLCLPCFLPSMVRGWRYVLAVVLPLGVLLVWEHRPAQSLAFQYSSILLPVLWLSTMLGSQSPEPLAASGGKSRWRLPSWSGGAAALGAFATASTLSLFLGQFPFSSRTLQDVQVQTYQPAETEFRLQHGGADNLWLHDQVAKIRVSGDAVLATGRIAAHCVGNRDVETVGQFAQRRDKLAKLADRLNQPMLHYQWVILDRLEHFQQNEAEIEAVEREAIRSGFAKVDEQYGIVVYTNPANKSFPRRRESSQ